MKHKREPLKNGYILEHNGMRFKICSLLGSGGNAMVYTAEYEDSVVKNGIHKCVIKELFPCSEGSGIYRGKRGEIIRSPESSEFFELHKRSFLHGNLVHLKILGNAPDSVGPNFDSFEENNTVYSILGLNSVCSLRRRYAGVSISIHEVTDIMIKLLKAVEVFHRNNILHLDISPDNVIISSSGGEERVLLIDFNSCSITGENLEYLSVNPKYSAPELALGRNNSVCAATDIFSVCAVFVYLITGREFEYALFDPRELTDAEMLSDAPLSAVSYLMGMLRRGLRAKPSLRFETVTDMLEACYELRNRIDSIGITHSSLWEASWHMRGDESEELLDNSIRYADKVLSAHELLSVGNTVVSGEGGIGKTTLYKQLWYLKTRRYDPCRPVVFYVPLYRYDQTPDYIKRYILSKIRFGRDISTVSDAIQRLTELMNGNKPFISLLLDGFNEISGDKTNILREIDALGKMQGAIVSVSVRTDNITFDQLKGFTAVSLLPLEGAQVREYLNKRGIAYPEDEGLRRLLRNPLMLTLYAKTEEVFFKSEAPHKTGAATEDVINEYLKSILEAYKQSAPEDTEGRIRLKYVLGVLFPALCAEAQKRTVLDFKTVLSVCGKDYRRLRSGAFSKAFPDYSGRAKEILRDAENAREWMNIALYGILINDTALMTRENDGYYPRHMKFSECLVRKHKENMTRYRKAVIGKRLPVAAAAVILSIISAAIIYYFMPGTHPIGKREQLNNREIMIRVISSMNNIVQMTLGEERLIQFIDADDRESGNELIHSVESSLEVIGNGTVEMEHIEELSYIGLDVERVKKIISMSAQHREFQRDMFIRLRNAMSSGLYSVSEIREELENYKEYLDGYKKILGYELCLLSKGINRSGTEEIRAAMQGSGDIVMSYNSALEMDPEDVENSIHSMEMRLDGLKSKLTLIGS